MLKVKCELVGRQTVVARRADKQKTVRAARADKRNTVRAARADVISKLANLRISKWGRENEIM